MCSVAAALALFLSFHAEKKSMHGEEKYIQAQEGALSIMTKLNCCSEMDKTVQANQTRHVYSSHCSVVLL